MSRRAELIARITRLNLQMQRSRDDVARTGWKRAEAIAELADLVGVSEAARILGLNRTSVHRIVRGTRTIDLGTNGR